MLKKKVYFMVISRNLISLVLIVLRVHFKDDNVSTHLIKFMDSNAR